MVRKQHLMRWFVLRLFADRPFSPDHLAKAIIVIHPETFVASGHSFVACRQQLSFVLLPGVECVLFVITGENVIFNDYVSAWRSVLQDF